MKIYKIFLSILMLIFSSCDGRSKEAKIVHKLERETFEEVYKKYGLGSEGIGKQAPKSNLKMCESLSLRFGTFRIIDKNEGRKILLDISDTFLKKINGHNELQPYMTDWPVTEKNLKISLVVHSTPGVDWNINNVRYFFFNDRGITFSYDIPNESFWTRDEKETLEEARAKLK